MAINRVQKVLFHGYGRRLIGVLAAMGLVGCPGALLPSLTLDWMGGISSPGMMDVADMAVGSNGDVLVLGTGVGENSENTSPVVYRLDGQGTVRWSRAYAESAPGEGGGLIVSGDGGFVLAGLSRSDSAGRTDMYIMKAAADGTEEWSARIGGRYFDGARSVVATRDGGYVLAGFTESFGEGVSDRYLAKLDGAGNVLWTQTYGTAQFEDAIRIREYRNGDLMVLGVDGPGVYNTQQSEPSLTRLTPEGVVRWHTILARPTRFVENTARISASDFREREDGQFFVLGKEGDVFEESILITVDQQGVERARVPVDGDTLTASYDRMVPTADGGYLLSGSEGAGYGRSRAVAIKLDDAGAREWKRRGPTSLYMFNTVVSVRGPESYVFAARGYLAESGRDGVLVYGARSD